MGIEAVAYAGLQKLFPDSEEEAAKIRQLIYFPPPEGSNYCTLTPHPAFSAQSDYFDSPGLFVFNGGSRVESLYPSWAHYTDFKAALADEIVKRPWSEIYDGALDEDTAKGDFFEFLYMQEKDFPPLFGPTTSEKLYNDFSAHVNEAEGVGSSFYKTYQKLMGCFEVAQKTGAVLIRAR